LVAIRCRANGKGQVVARGRLIQRRAKATRGANSTWLKFIITPGFSAGGIELRRAKSRCKTQTAKGEMGRSGTEGNEGNEARWPPFVSFVTFCYSGRAQRVFAAARQSYSTRVKFNTTPRFSAEGVELWRAKSRCKRQTAKGEMGRTGTEGNKGNEARWPPFVSFVVFRSDDPGSVELWTGAARKRGAYGFDYSIQVPGFSAGGVE
jgi:hypothetical protein